ncbi:MAG: helix-turn-helix transcriptional regulator [Lachnospiraceae bacterium]|nr:helix-turn-helix transcriptional regulator [Lachnospiraceae bacterium]MBQ7833919.1 helix-turn-helix transcriptional regulator [Lachnospiraceae bacterium]
MILELGKKLKLARINNGLSRKQVAELTGVSVAMIGHYETGERAPSLSILVKLAAQYKVSLDYLLDNNLTSDSISLDGLTTKQKQIIKQTIECFRDLSS